MKVLIVDDNTLNRKLLRTILASDGHSVVDAADGLAALEVLEREKIDAVISDILMPRMDGYRLCYEMRRSEKWNAIPFIAYTAAYTSPADEQVALDFGSDKFIRKPASAADVLNALHEVMEVTNGRHAKPLRAAQELLAMREYSEALVRKLEESNLELGQANKVLEERALLAEFNARVANALTHKDSLREILQRCTEAIVHHLGAAFARVWTVNQKENILELQASAGLYTHIDGGHARVPVGQDKIGLIASERKPHLTNSVIGDTRGHEQEWAKREGIVAFAGYPLIVEDQLVGVMAMFARKPLTVNALKAMESVAKSIAVGIRGKWADEEREKILDRIRALHEIDLALTSTLDLQTVLNVLLEKIDLFIPYPSVTNVRLLDKQTGELKFLACRNIDEAEWRRPITATPTRRGYQVLQTKTPHMVRNLLLNASSYSQSLYQRHGLISYIGVPLIVQDDALGVLNLYTKVDHEFTDEEVEFLTAVAAQAAIAIQNARLHEETERRGREAEELARTARFLTETLDMSAVGERIVTSVRGLFVVEGATLRLLQPDGSLRHLASCGEVLSQRNEGNVVPSGMGLAGRAVTERKTICSADVLIDPKTRLTDEMRDFQARSGNRSMIAAPLRAHEKLIGTLTLSGRTGRSFSQNETALLQTFADQAALALENARLYEETARSKKQLETTNQQLGKSLKQLGGFYTALTPIAPGASIQELIGGIIERLMAATGADSGLIRVWDKETNTLPIIGHRGFSDDYLKRVETAPPSGAVAWVIKHNEPIIAPDITSEPRLKGKVQLQAGLRSCAILPLNVHDQVRGILHIASCKLGFFDEEQKDHLIAIARQMSIALENREQFYSLQSSRNELERAITVKDEFLSVMSHELRTPLNVIMGYTALLRDGMFGELSREQDNALQTVTIQSRDQLSIINELLQATQIGCGESPVSRTAVNLTRFLDELRTAYDLPTKKNLLINWDYPMDLPSVDTDSGKLKEILQNLIGNALKFTEEGTVNITARYMPEAQTIVVKVADTGIGIPKELVPTIFEKFRQVDSSATRIFGGVGLGLYIVKKYTELLGGDIRVESEPGIGSVFTVVIPSQTQASTPKLNLAILEESR